MSRCFPFPPPGYEKKDRNDDIDLLTKEKHKEKKHKKEKRDKEKREGKDKKDKEKSKDKHRDKKDRKEKHKDKKKDKDKDKDKNKTSDERKLEGGNEGDIGHKLGETSQRAEELKDSKFMEELGRRIRDDKGSGNQMVERITLTDQRRTEGVGRPTEKDIEKRISGKEKNKEVDTRKEDEHRERDDGRGTGNQMLQNLFGTDHRRSEALVRTMEGLDGSMEKNAENKVQGKEKNKDKGMGRLAEKIGTDQKRFEGMGRLAEKIGTDQKRFEGMGRLAEKIAMDQKRFEGMGRPAEKMGTDQKQFEGMGRQAEKMGTDKKQFDGMDRRTDKVAKNRVEGKEKNKEGSDGKKANKHRGKDREEKRKAKDKHRDKAKEKEKEKVKVKGENKHKEQDRLKGNSKEEQPDSLTFKPSYPPKDSHKNTGIEGNLKKRKDVELNGFVHESNTWPNKMPRPASSSHMSMENGRKLESCQIVIQCASDRQGMTDSKKTEINKECKVNGIIEALPHSVNLRPSVVPSVLENGEASTRPPHPDAKYLSQILTVPKMDGWSDFDDQEWLFHSDFKPRVAVEYDETPQVWAEAVRIDSADVCALPYVIPY